MPRAAATGGTGHRGYSADATTRAHIANEIAPGSGVPTLRSASGRARPTLGRRVAVAWAAFSATSAAWAHACASGVPAATAASSASANGSIASSIVLSPKLALPRV